MVKTSGKVMKNLSGDLYAFETNIPPHTRNALFRQFNDFYFFDCAFFTSGQRRTFSAKRTKNIVQGRNIFYGCSIHEKTRFTLLRSLLLIRRVNFDEDSYKRDQLRTRNEESENCKIVVCSSK